VPLTDALGVAHGPALAGFRIISLVPSITELLLDLGLRAHVVGRTGFCIHPHALVRDIPKVGGTKDVKLERVRELAPTHAIVNIDENELPTVEALRQFVPHIVVTHPQAPEDNLALYRLMGELFGCGDEAERLCTALQRELAACRSIDWPRARVLYLIWRDPWMTIAADTYIARTLALVGWEVPHGPGGERGAARYPVLDEFDAEVARVDRVLLSSEPFMFRARHVASLRARFPGKPIELLDGEMTSWYGSRAIAGLVYLRERRAAEFA
jgi:ABC-type Fe3+-hydroxamate transport system substrate-binding protein